MTFLRRSVTFFVSFHDVSCCASLRVVFMWFRAVSCRFVTCRVVFVSFRVASCRFVAFRVSCFLGCANVFTLGSLRFTKILLVGKHIKILLRNRRTPQPQANPTQDKMKLKVEFGRFFSTASNFSWGWDWF